MSTRCLLFFS